VDRLSTRLGPTLEKQQRKRPSSQRPNPTQPIRRRPNSLPAARLNRRGSSRRRRRRTSARRGPRDARLSGIDFTQDTVLKGRDARGLRVTTFRKRRD
jgi:hypothetical protein